MPSVAEVSAYILLGAAITSAVFVVGGRPLSHVAIVGAAAVTIIVALVVVAPRTRLTRHAAPPPEPGEVAPIGQGSDDTQTKPITPADQADTPPQQSPYELQKRQSTPGGRRGRRRRH